MTREEAIKEIKELACDINVNEIREHPGAKLIDWCNAWHSRMDLAIKALIMEPKRIKGSWFHVGHDEYQCSCCGFTFIGDDTEDENFCQFCGADMGAES